MNVSAVLGRTCIIYDGFANPLLLRCNIVPEIDNSAARKVLHGLAMARRAIGIFVYGIADRISPGEGLRG